MYVAVDFNSVGAGPALQLTSNNAVGPRGRKQAARALARDEAQSVQLTARRVVSPEVAGDTILDIASGQNSAVLCRLRGVFVDSGH